MREHSVNSVGSGEGCIEGVSDGASDGVRLGSGDGNGKGTGDGARQCWRRVALIDSLQVCPQISESKRPQNEYSVGLNDGSKDGAKEGFLDGCHVETGTGDTVGSDVGKESREKEYEES